MSQLSFLKRGTATALSLLLGIGFTTPLILSTPASAQLLPGERRTQSRTGMAIPSGTSLPVRSDEAEKIVVMPDETAPVTLQIAANIKDRQGRILIPYGTELVGEIRPVSQQNGSRFVAQEIKVPGESARSINASSQVVTQRETIKRGASTGDILEGAAIGGAAAAVIAEITGSIEAVEVLGGAGLGALGGLLLNKNEVEVISIDPNQDLDITLDSRLALSN